MWSKFWKHCRGNSYCSQYPCTWSSKEYSEKRRLLSCIIWCYKSNEQFPVLKVHPIPTLKLTDGCNRFLPNTCARTRRHSVTFQKTTVIVLCVGMMSEICDRKYGPYVAIVCLPRVFYFSGIIHFVVSQMWQGVTFLHHLTSL